MGDINSGHYFSYIKKGGFWLSFNDSSVEKIENIEFKSNTGCGLFNVRNN